MIYDEVQTGQRVFIETVTPRYQVIGTVRFKEITRIAGKPVERVWVDTDDRRRRICSPTILTLVDG